MAYQLFFLREQPQYLATIADWIYRQWWAGTDTSTEAIEHWLNTHLGEGGFPTTFVLVSQGEVAGSVSLHETEAEDRPAYRPYLGALFVKPESRGRGFGAALVRTVETHASRLGQAAIYLNAAGPVTPFYERLGWRMLNQAMAASSSTSCSGGSPHGHRRRYGQLKPSLKRRPVTAQFATGRTAWPRPSGLSARFRLLLPFDVCLDPVETHAQPKKFGRDVMVAAAILSTADMPSGEPELRHGR